jgi:hypothetical protein
MGHRRARLTPFGRYLLVTRILQDGWSVSATAESLGPAPGGQEPSLPSSGRRHTLIGVEANVNRLALVRYLVKDREYPLLSDRGRKG